MLLVLESAAKAPRCALALDIARFDHGELLKTGESVIPTKYRSFVAVRDQPASSLAVLDTHWKQKYSGLGSGFAFTRGLGARTCFYDQKWLFRNACVDSARETSCARVWFIGVGTARSALRWAIAALSEAISVGRADFMSCNIEGSCIK